MQLDGEPTKTPSPQADQLAAKALRHCDVISRMTETDGEITRRFLTQPIKQAHQYLSEVMESLGMTVRVDHAGNLVGRRTGIDSAKTLLIGSHLDTVPGGGKYDGLLGVTLGLAVLELVGKADLPFNIDVIGFSEEEGVRFAQPYLGSSAIAGCFNPAWLDRVDNEGQTMRSVIADFGLMPDQISEASYGSAEVVGFVETHIEQGPLLHRVDRPVGLVDAIAGQSRLLLRFSGQQGHAGTAPMNLRKDALVAAARWTVEVSSLGQSIEGLRATVGRIHASPNIRNVIADQVELSLDVRHFDDQIRQQAVSQLCQTGAEWAKEDGTQFEILEEQTQPAVQMDSSLCELMSASMAASGIGSFSMFSGAGHDAAVLAAKFPSTMLFIRQASGISHHPDEDVAAEDVAVAIEVLAEFVTRLANQFRAQDKPTKEAR